MTKSHERIGAEFESIRTKLEGIAVDLKAWLTESCRELAIYAPRIDGRVKETHSLLLKIVRKEHQGRLYEDPLREMSDKVGVRVDVIYALDVDRLLARIFEATDVFEPIATHDVEDKRLSLGENQVGYVGVHIGVVPRKRHGIKRDFAKCEIQLRTNAQAAWAMASHELVYKPPVVLPSTQKRKVNRLTALLELFDEQIAEAQKAMTGNEGYPLAIVVQALQAERFRFVSREYDRDLTREIVSIIAPNQDAESAHALARQIHQFVDDNEDTLRPLIRSTQPLLVSQPEAILIFMLLERDVFALQSAWTNAGLPNALLENLANRWSVRLPEPL